MKNETYYIGLDMGTTSVGWAVTDEHYHLLRAKGKDLWGVRLFDEAQTSVERRTNRIARRRRQREKARIGLLKNFFADEINKLDTGFYQRCDESKLWKEDRSESNQQTYALFADKNYTDEDYYREYKTIFHLRKELIESKEPHDVRLVYLAVLNIFKHRGHFLNSGDIHISENAGMGTLWTSMRMLAADVEIYIPESASVNEVEGLLANDKLSRTKKYEGILTLLEISKTRNKREAELIKLICGMSAKCGVLFGDEISDEEVQKKSLSFNDINYEMNAYEIETQVSDEAWELVEKAKEIYDVCLLSNLRRGCTYLSQARVEAYKKHAEDLQRLKGLVKKYVPEEYDAFFRTTGKDNYSAYVGSVNSDEKTRRGGSASRDEFYKRVKKLLSQMPETDENVCRIREDIEREDFLPKQLTASNGVIPNQLHLAELHIILENASAYLDFLNEKDDTGLSVKEKIEHIFKFQIPYYVGPLNDYHKDKGGNAWVVRKERGQVFPWNLEEKIDIHKSREEFIRCMVRQCTYLNEEKVLPKNSLLYEKFMVLNELNNLKIRDEKISVELKQRIFNELFAVGKKVTEKALRDYLIKEGIIKKEETDAVSGIDGGFHTSLSSLGKFKGALGERALEWSMQKAIEKIIFWGTVYSNDKKVVKECIKKEFPDLFSEAELKRILGFKFKDWGRLSKEFLELEGADKETGEIMSVMQRMWESNENLMQILSGRYTYQEALTEKTKNAIGTLSEVTYEDIEAMNLSAPVRRMVWQTLLVLQDLQKVLKGKPEKIFVEMARGGGKAGERKQSRKKKFQELYKSCREEKELIESLENQNDSTLRSKKLYLYYLQKGRCMYTGEPINFGQLFSNIYDIDHIYPRHFVKDDNIDNNLVLVKKEKNAHKSDTFPIEPEIQRTQAEFWKSLRIGGFMNEEKYRRLTRPNEFTPEDKAGFISRQLVETTQGTKIMTQILGNVFPDTEIAFPKGGNVSDFRKKFKLLKVRNVNDFHHAQDAYLNIVVGNSYLVKFTHDPRNFIRDYERDEKKYAYNLGRMFEKDIVRKSETAWIASEKGKEDSGSIVAVKRVMERNTPLVTRMNFEVHGGITNKQTVYGKKEAKEGVYLPMKTTDSHIADVEKYGGKMGITGAYFFVVEHDVKKKRIRTIEIVPVYLKNSIEASENGLLDYCKTELKLVNPRICVKKLKVQSLVKWNGFYLHITGRSENRLSVRNAVPLCLKQEWLSYVKALNSFVEKGLAEGDETPVTKEQNKELFEILLDKHMNGIYAKKPNPLTEKMKSWQEKFNAADLEAQVEAILEILKMTECANNSMKAQKLGFSSAGMKINNNVSSADEFLLINQSPSGLFESVIDLKTV